MLPKHWIMCVLVWGCVCTHVYVCVHVHVWGGENILSILLCDCEICSATPMQISYIRSTGKQNRKDTVWDYNRLTLYGMNIWTWYNAKIYDYAFLELLGQLYQCYSKLGIGETIHASVWKGHLLKYDYLEDTSIWEVNIKMGLVASNVVSWVGMKKFCIF
jgi:hypothetical protein